jgi:hypothetical protein
MQSAVIQRCWQILPGVSSTKRVAKPSEPLATATRRSSGRPPADRLADGIITHWQTTRGSSGRRNHPRTESSNADRLADGIIRIINHGAKGARGHPFG